MKVLDFGLAKTTSAPAADVSRELADRQHGRHASRRDPGHGRVHESRAGARQDRRQARRYLGFRGGAVRDAHWRTAIPGGRSDGDAGSGGERGTAFGAGSGAGAAAAAEVFGERSEAAVAGYWRRLATAGGGAGVRSCKGPSGKCGMDRRGCAGSNRRDRAVGLAAAGTACRSHRDPLHHRSSRRNRSTTRNSGVPRWIAHRFCGRTSTGDLRAYDGSPRNKADCGHGGRGFPFFFAGWPVDRLLDSAY